MPPWKLLLLSLYYHGSTPLRWWNHRRERRQRRVPVVVLYYHRIADDGATPWTMPNDAFTRQIQWLRRHFELISLEETQRRIRSGTNDRPSVSITFDDGYADNCQHAIPWLVKERIPCTYFVTAKSVLEGVPFDHDVALGHRLLPNNVEQLRAMAAAGIEIGAHTYSHANLARVLDRNSLRLELVSAREQLQAAVGRPMRYFAFPFGQYDHLSREAFRMAAESGYAGVCSAYGGFNYPGDDAFHVQRIPSDILIRVKNWVTGDPRKRNTRRYEWRTGDSESWSTATTAIPAIRS